MAAEEAVSTAVAEADAGNYLNPANSKGPSGNPGRAFFLLFAEATDQKPTPNP